MANPLVDPQVAQEKYPHGTRARYVLAKCRCDDCRKANTTYQKDRDRRAKEASIGVAQRPRSFRMRKKLTRLKKGKKRRKRSLFIFKRACPGVLGQPCSERAYLRKDSGGACSNCRAKLIGQVPADAVRKHLQKLSKLGVGYKSVAIAADVGRTVLMKVLHGKATIRSDLAHRVLQVDEGAIADRALVSSKTTLNILEEMQSRGLTLTKIAEMAGWCLRNVSGLKKRSRVAASTELTFKKALNKLREDQDQDLYDLYRSDVRQWCPQCEKEHYNGLCPLDLATLRVKGKNRRQELLRKILPPEKLKSMDFQDVQELREMLPKIYTGKKDAAYQKLHRDLKAIGYVSTKKNRPSEE